jgi:hypothetical protein
MSNQLQRGGLLLALVLVGANAEAQDEEEILGSGGGARAVTGRPSVALLFTKCIDS